VQVLTAVPGWPSLDRNAVEALKKWTYRPAMKDGDPVSVYATVAVQFRLEEADQLEVINPD
jgi:TonB family protein